MPNHSVQNHLTAFLAGAVVLVIEIIGARMLAPYLGAAYFVWVNIIGVILASLALGYWLGGVAADSSKNLLPGIFLLAAFFAALLPLERGMLPFFGVTLGIRLGSLIASLVLFAPISILLGMVSPYLVKLETRNLGHLGRSSGSIFAVSTAGSIGATFATGFLLIPRFPVSKILWGLTAILAALAFWNLPRRRGRVALLALAPLLLGIVSARLAPRPPAQLLLERESAYYNIRVVERARETGDAERTLLLDGSPQSARLIKKRAGDRISADDLAFPYIALSAKIIDALKPAPERMLALGGGGYTIPEYVKRRSPASDVTVVEIDPAVSRVAGQFFIEPATGPLRTVLADARVFLNTERGTFDLVYTDAYSGAFSIPSHLATAEALGKIQELLAADGLVLANISATLEGENAEFLRSFWKALRQRFGESAIFATRPQEPLSPQNVVIVAQKTKSPSFEEGLRTLERFRYRNALPTLEAPLYTDDYPPTDVLMEKLVMLTYPALRAYWEQ